MFPSERLMLAIVEKPGRILGTRKMVQGVSISFDSLPPVNLRELNYTIPAKMNQLKRTYFNEEEILAAKEKMKVREDKEFTSVAISMRNGVKDSRSQGHCMQTTVITESNGFISADVMYRSTEAIQKFSADLAFLPHVFELMEIQPDVIRFYFANAYLSSMFLPLYLKHADPKVLLTALKKHDPRFFNVVKQTLLRFAEPSKQYAFQARQKQHDYAQEHLDFKRIIPYLED